MPRNAIFQLTIRLFIAAILSAATTIAHAANYESNYPSMSVTGSFNDWRPGRDAMHLIGANAWEIQVRLNNGDRIKFTPFSNWSVSYGDKNLDGVAGTSGGGNIPITRGNGYYNIRFNDATGVYSIKRVELADSPPTANAGEDLTVEVGSNVMLTAEASSDPNGDIAHYRWSGGFGDGVDVNKTMATIGTFTISLVVTDSAGMSDTDSLTITVVEESLQSNHDSMHLVGSFNGWNTSATDMTLIEDHTWEVLLALSTGDRFKFVPVSWALSYGDKNKDGIADTSGGGNITIGTGDGIYRVLFNDQSDAYSARLTEQPELPPSAHAGNDQTVEVGDVVHLSAVKSSDPNNDIINYNWDNGFNDGVTVSKIMDTAGSFTVTLTVTDDNGLTDIDTVVINVTEDLLSMNHPNMHIAGSFNAWSISATEMALIDDHTWQLDLDLLASDKYKFVPTNWSLSYGDNNRDGLADNSGGGNIIVTSGTGRYRVTFNDETLAHSSVRLDQQNRPPLAHAGGNQTVEVGTTVTLSAENTSDPDDNIASYQWDNAFGSGLNVNRQMDIVGTFTVTLTVTDEHGLSDKDTVTIEVIEVTSGPEVVVDKHRSHSIVLSSSTTYNGSTGAPNPFTDIQLSATITSPSGRVTNAVGFFNGDGNGDQSGNEFVVRIATNESGIWNWATTSNDNDLNGLSGSFNVSNTTPSAFAHGPITVTSEHPTKFSYADGTPVLLIGKFLDHSVAPPLRYSHTFFSGQLSEQDREAMFSRHVAMGVNKINLYLANVGDYGSMSVNLWEGSSHSSDKSRFSVSRWQHVEQWLERFRDAGIIAHIWMFADDSSFGRVATEDLKRISGYAMARLSSHVNTMFTVALEWQESFSLSKINSLGLHTQQNNPWDRLVSVHELNGDYTLYNSPWVDFMDTQPGFVNARDIYNHGVRHRTLGNKPLLIEEFSFGEETSGEREKTWAALMSIPAGIGTGASLTPLPGIADRVSLHRMTPMSAQTTVPSRLVAGEHGLRYLVYQADGGAISLSLPNINGDWYAYWINPRTGEFSQVAASIANGTVNVSTPDSKDWALYISVEPI